MRCSVHITCGKEWKLARGHMLAAVMLAAGSGIARFACLSKETSKEPHFCQPHVFERLQIGSLPPANPPGLAYPITDAGRRWSTTRRRTWCACQKWLARGGTSVQDKGQTSHLEQSRADASACGRRGDMSAGTQA